MAGYPVSAYRRGSQVAPGRRTPAPSRPSRPLPVPRRRPNQRPEPRERPSRPHQPVPRPAPGKPGRSPLPGSPEPFPRLKSWPRPRRFPLGKAFGPLGDLAVGVLIDKYPWLGTPPPWSPFFPQGFPIGPLPAGWVQTAGPCSWTVIPPATGMHRWYNYHGVGSCISGQALSKVALCENALCNTGKSLYLHRTQLVPTADPWSGGRWALVVEYERVSGTEPGPALAYSPVAEPMPTRWALPGWEPVPIIFSLPGGALAPNPYPRPVTMPRPVRDPLGRPVRGPHPLNDPDLYPESVPLPAPIVMPGSAPRPGPRPRPAPTPGIATGGNPMPRPRNGFPRRPNKGDREGKAQGPAKAIAAFMAAVAYGATEALDAVAAFHAALPRQYRTSNRPKDQVQDLLDHWDRVDIAKGLRNLAIASLVDIAVAKGIRRAQGFATDQGVFLGRAIAPNISL